MKKKKKILLLVGLLLLLVAGAVGAFLGLRKPEPVVEEVTSKLYWNADRDEYIPKLGGDTIRKPEEDGLWTVRFLVEGELVEYRVADKDVMIEVDRQSVLGLEFDEEGIITGVIDIRDLGYREVAKSFYVQTMDEKTVVANSSFTGSEVDVSLNMSKETRIWNVTGLVEPLGVEDDLQLMDCIRAFNNDSGVITDVFIVEREELMAGVSPERYCAHCDQVVTWRMWLAGASLPYASGHFRLMKDVELKDQYSMAEDRDIVLDLNGKTISRKTEGRVISLHKPNDTLSIVDGSEEQTGMIKAHGEFQAQGGVVWVRYGTFNLYAGTINASEATVLAQYGTAVFVNKETTFNMYGGTIIGGLSQAAVLTNEETGKKSTSGGMGGSVYCIGTMNMYDGEILDGKVASCVAHTGKMKSTAGGNIALNGEGVLNMYGGRISGGKLVDANGHGGNISVKSAKSVLNMTGGTIENGVSLLQGGNIASWGTINMSGGAIKNGKNMKGESLKGAALNEESTTHNLFLVSATLNMSGGTIEGYVGGTKGTQDKSGEYIDWKVVLSGSPVIYGGKTNLTIGSCVLELKKLSAKAKIGANGSGFISTETAEANKKYVHSDIDGADVIYHEKRLFIGKQNCVCGLNENGEHYGACDGTLLAWQPWTKDISAPTKEGNWYLLSDIQLKGITEPAENTTLCVDLNGKKIIGKEDRRVYSTVNGNVSLTITDLSSEKTGSIVGQTGSTPEKLGKGGCVWAYKNSNITFYGGTLDATKAVSPANGVAVAVEKNCSFTMYGGTINGGSAIKEATPNKNGKYQQGYAGAVYVVGKFDMKDGVIQGGSAEQNGGNIYVDSSGVFNLGGGKLLDGKAVSTGGNIAGYGGINIMGGVVAGGEAPYGGNIRVGRKMNMTGGEIKDGIAEAGGNIYATDSTTLTISGGTISGGKATKETGGNIRVWTNSKFDIANAVVKDGVAKTEGGNIYLNDKVTATITNTTISGGKASTNGGNICIGKGSKDATTVSITGGNIREGYAKKLGGNVYVVKGDVTLAGAVEILDGTTVDNVPSNLYLKKGVTIELNGLTSKEKSIGVTCVSSTFATNANADRSDLTRFFSDEKYSIAQSSENEIFLGKIGCLCGAYHNNVHATPTEEITHAAWCTEDKHEIEWHAWRNSSSLPTTTGAYYLTEDVAMSERTQPSKDAIVYLDLNGYTVTKQSNDEAAYNRVFQFDRAGVNYTITDSSSEQDGKICFEEGFKSITSGELFFVNASNVGDVTLNIYGGTYDMSGIEKAINNPIQAHKSNFNIYGGTFIPAADSSGSTNCIAISSGTLSVYGGTIYGEVYKSSVEGSISLSGSPKVGVQYESNARYGIMPKKDTAIAVNCTDVTADAQIVLKSTTNINLSGTGEASAFVITDAIEGKYNQIVDDNATDIGNLTLGAKLRSCGDVNCTGNSTTHTCELPSTVWQAWDNSNTTLPTATGAYYLTGDITSALRTRPDESAKIYLDLNGYTFTKQTGSEADHNRVFQLDKEGVSYTITDSSSEKTGKICFDKDFTSMTAGELFFFTGTGKTVNIHGGTYDMSNIANVTNNPVQVGKNTINICGGTFKPAASKGKDAVGNCIGASAGTINISGGNIYGEVVLTGAGSISLSGSPKVGVQYENNTNYGIGLTGAYITMNCNNVAADARIVLKDSAFIKLSGTGEASAFTIIDNHNQVVDDNEQGIGTLSFKAKLRSCGDVNCTGNSTSHTCDLPEVWQSWNTAISKAASSDAVTLPGITAGAYYLTENLELTDRANVGAARTVHLDLNGYKVTKASNSADNGAANRVIQIGNVGAKYTITDSSSEKTGKICFKEDFKSIVAGELFFFSKAGTVNIYGGQFDMSNIQSANGEPVKVQSGTINIHGGTFKPAASKASTAKSNCISASKGTINISGGTIYGEVVLTSTGNLTISGSPTVGARENDTDTYDYGINTDSGNLVNTSKNATIVYK